VRTHPALSERGQRLVLLAVLHLYVRIKFVWPPFYTSGHAVTRLVEALRCKSEGRGIDSRWCYWKFSLTSFRSLYGSGVDSASNRNEYQESFLG
jgi:hypothetical protein